MSQCQVRIVSATISSSVRMSAVKEMATTCTNSDSNSTRAPYMRMPPDGAKGNKSTTWCCQIGWVWKKLHQDQWDLFSWRNVFFHAFYLSFCTLLLCMYGFLIHFKAHHNKIQQHGWAFPPWNHKWTNDLSSQTQIQTAGVFTNRNQTHQLT